MNTTLLKILAMQQIVLDHSSRLHVCTHIWGPMKVFACLFLLSTKQLLSVGSGPTNASVSEMVTSARSRQIPIFLSASSDQIRLHLLVYTQP